MTIAQLIAYVDEIKPNAFSDATKLVWVNEVEGMVQSEVLLRAQSECVEYTATSSSLIVLPPYSKLYAEYLMARIDYANGEYDKYQNTMQMFNGFFEDYKTWYNRVYRPTAYRGYRTIQSIFDYVDEVKPNAIASATKLVWLNEIEGRVQTEIFLWNESECFVYNYAYSGSADVYFPDEHTLAFSDKSLLKNFRPGGKITSFSPASPYAANAFSEQIIQSITEDGLVFTESFATTGETPVSTTINYNGDYDAYRVSLNKFQDAWGEFSRWFARVYAPANRHITWELWRCRNEL